jgi:hypothetical protein
MRAYRESALLGTPTLRAFSVCTMHLPQLAFCSFLTLSLSLSLSLFLCWDWGCLGSRPEDAPMYEAFRIILNELAIRSERLSWRDGWYDRLPLPANRRFDAQVHLHALCPFCSQSSELRVIP